MALPNQTNQNFFAEKFAKKFGSNWVHWGFGKFAPCPNAEPDLWSGLAKTPKLGPNFGSVLKSSGSNFGSEPNYGIPIYGTSTIYFLGYIINHPPALRCHVTRPAAYRLRKNRHHQHYYTDSYRFQLP